MSRTYVDTEMWTRPWERKRGTYSQPDIGDSDERIQRFVEEGRREYYEAWIAYLSEDE